MPLTNRCINITLNAAVAGLFWIVGVGLTLGDWVGWLHDDAGFFGIAAVAGGHLLCMHGLFARQQQREADAFRFGRESVRSIR